MTVGTVGSLGPERTPLKPSATSSLHLSSSLAERSGYVCSSCSASEELSCSERHGRKLRNTIHIVLHYKAAVFFRSPRRL